MIPDSGKHFGRAANITLFKGKGCVSCQHTGYLGRTGLFEILPATPELRELILKKPSIAEIYELEARQGVRSLFEDGLEKVKAGITTIEEVKRVAEPRQMKSAARI